MKADLFYPVDSLSSLNGVNANRNDLPPAVLLPSHKIATGVNVTLKLWFNFTNFLHAESFYAKK